MREHFREAFSRALSHGNEKNYRKCKGTFTTFEPIKPIGFFDFSSTYPNLIPVSLLKILKINELFDRGVSVEVVGIKEIYPAFSISITLFLNHLK